MVKKEISDEYYGADKDAFFKRLDSIDRGELPVEKIGLLSQEMHLFDIDWRIYQQWGIEWISIRYPKILPQERASKLTEYFGLGARKKALFKRLDDIDSGRIPLKEVKKLEQEAWKFKTNKVTLKRWGKEWVSILHPEIPDRDRGFKFKEYYGFGYPPERNRTNRTRNQTYGHRAGCVSELGD